MSAPVTIFVRDMKIRYGIPTEYGYIFNQCQSQNCAEVWMPELKIQILKIFYCCYLSAVAATDRLRGLGKVSAQNMDLRLERLSLLRRTGVRAHDCTTKLIPPTPLWTKESKNSRPLDCDAIGWTVEGWNFVVLVYDRTAMVKINGLGINWRRPPCLSMSIDSNWKIVYIAWCAKVSSLQSLPPTKQHVCTQASQPHGSFNSFGLCSPPTWLRGKRSKHKYWRLY